MLVSWNWLQDYLKLSMSPTEVAERLMMAGINHEDTTAVSDDWAIDLEVTSNRPDCLGHLGIAREIGVLFDLPVQLPAASPHESSTPVTSLTRVRVTCPNLCPRYSARVIQGVKISPSPSWLARRLATIGVTPINNVVDITNYVLMESGQPLHAFDLTKLQGREILVREARQGESFVAIDHKTYTLAAGMCVIADAQSPVAIAGVMGGEASEVSGNTTELLIESAEFAPLSVRTTARQLNLHSPSSYRFERGVDPAGLDWASRRCCELILELAGGTLASGSIVVGRDLPPLPQITLRLSQLKRILGIAVPVDVVRRILVALGNRESPSSDPEQMVVTPPSWRRDLTREVDLVEEVARIHGYDKIPEDVAVPMCPSHRRDEDRVLARVRGVLTGAGFDEAFTASVVPGSWCSAFTPWTSASPLISGMPMLKGADHLRVSLIPSLLEARRTNEAVSNRTIELFETARIYLPQPGKLPAEPWTLGLTSGANFELAKGVVESLLESVYCQTTLETLPIALPLLDSERSAEFRINGRSFAFVGELTPAGLKQFGLRAPTTIAEVCLDLLAECANLVPQYSELSSYPAITRDMNLIVDEAVRWADLAHTVGQVSGGMLERLSFREIYRDAQKDGPGKKRVLFSCDFRASDRTFTSEEADEIRDRIVSACSQQHAAKLLA